MILGGFLFGGCKMELNINSLSYFKEHYGVDDEVYKFCQKANLFFRDKEYSEILHTIGIIPVIGRRKYMIKGNGRNTYGFLTVKALLYSDQNGF